MTRIALLVPQRNAALEPESYRLVPPEVSVHFARLPGSVATPAELLTLRSEIGQAWQSLQDLRPAAIGFACTSGSFYGGRKQEAALRRHIEEITGLPTVTTAYAVAEACRYF